MIYSYNSDRPIRDKVHSVNVSLYKLCTDMSVKFIPNPFFTRNNFTGHGLHLNNSGKQVLKCAIVNETCDNIKETFTIPVLLPSRPNFSQTNRKFSTSFLGLGSR